IFADFDRFFPGKIVNMTNGVTPRLWLKQANPRLAELISAQIGSDWPRDLAALEALVPLAESAKFRKAFRAVKTINKERLANLVKARLGLEIDPGSMFDVQVKRIHEYKRQLLNVLHVVTRYNHIRHNPGLDILPRTVIFSGKAAPGYAMAKLVIRLINDVAEVVNNDPTVNGLLKVVFIPNYDVSTALDIIPAADLSEQISTAGTEASGTGNMKLAMNGALTIGTLDGANVEIREAAGEENIFIFGLTAEEVTERRVTGPKQNWHENQKLKDVLDMIGSGFFSPTEPDCYLPIVTSLTKNGDHYRLLDDYEAYVDCQERVDRLYRDQDEWARRAILNVARMGRFSSDRTIAQYSEEIWGVSEVPK
ncbi:MAG TPA: glycogen/starch/alpha-glucan phosphorylase, partial [Burkholderiales bacterium]|nr:glycogen/starch/alpha-glucan phosphorylase [Burkholderiales bacterium]